MARKTEKQQKQKQNSQESEDEEINVLDFLSLDISQNEEHVEIENVEVLDVQDSPNKSENTSKMQCDIWGDPMPSRTKKSRRELKPRYLA